ncbi:MAG: glycerophosphodiester phosphodiesterase, partial [Clostridia bacterium]|nr:glycerophosphodiester phosphodiesterase [Clostridia bacterium]
VEFDLNYTADGTPVLSHDTPKNGAVCVTLAEAFAFLAQQYGVRANVDVKSKSTEHLEKVPALAAEAGVAERIFFTGVDDKMMPAVREKCPGIPCYLNASVRKSDDVKALAKKTAALGAVGINLKWKDASPQLIGAFHEKGLPVSVWTVNRENDAIKMVRYGVDNITTRRPDLVCRLLKSIGKS